MTTGGRLLLVSTGLGTGGAESQVVLLAEAWRARGWAVTIATLIDPVAFGERLAAAGVSVVSLGMRRGIPDPRAVLALAALVRRWRPDVVHAHMVHANLLARCARLLAPMPVLVCTAHSVDEGGTALMRAYRWTDGLGDLLTQVSEAGLARYRALGVVRDPARLRVVPNGVPSFAASTTTRDAVRAALGTAADTTVVVCVARFEAVKNHDVLLDAWARIAHRGGELWLVGDGPLGSTVRAQAARTPGVRLLGVRTDVPAVLAAADLFVLPSRYEGLPMSLLEAAMAGVPVVATAVGGIPEIVRDGIDGRLVSPNDAEALAAALDAALAWPADERAAIGARLRTRVADAYALDAVVATWGAIYADLAARNAR
ncbi:MAG: glycosyltransferase [Gemmatimonadaceae bacterium]|nr:glycosyltransferase [Gemmatimonadaceae bacterium]